MQSTNDVRLFHRLGAPSLSPGRLDAEAHVDGMSSLPSSGFCPGPRWDHGQKSGLVEDGGKIIFKAQRMSTVFPVNSQTICGDWDTPWPPKKRHYRWMWVKMEDLGDHRC